MSVKFDAMSSKVLNLAVWSIVPSAAVAALGRTGKDRDEIFAELAEAGDFHLAVHLDRHGRLDAELNFHSRWILRIRFDFGDAANGRTASVAHRAAIL